MADPFRSPGDDPFQTPSLNQELPMPPMVGDPSIAQPYAPLGSNPPGKDRNGLAVAVISVLALIAIGAVVAAGYYVMKGIDSAGESWDTVFSSGDDWGTDPDFDDDWINTSFDYPEEITNLDALTAAPGETFTANYDPLRAGDDFSPGIYVAKDAAPRSAEDGMYCHWSVTENGPDDFDGFRASGVIESGTALMLVPDGYTVTAAAACGTWEAIDPQTLFEDTDGSQFGDENFVVGYDVKPGMYLSDNQVANSTDCYVNVRPHFGFEGQGIYGEYFSGDGGTIALEIEAGDLVHARDCPTFEWADPATAFSADAGADTIDPGTWIVGIDVRPGTYEGALDPESEYGYCYAEVWDGAVDWGKSVPVEDAHYYPDEEPESFTAQLGQTVYVDDCGPWTLVGSSQ